MSDKITATDFYVATGRDPEDDDLDRCNCDQAGTVGHWMCGWCTWCDRPRFVCGHRAPGATVGRAVNGEGGPND